MSVIEFLNAFPLIETVLSLIGLVFAYKLARMDLRGFASLRGAVAELVSTDLVDDVEDFAVIAFHDFLNDHGYEISIERARDILLGVVQLIDIEDEIAQG